MAGLPESIAEQSGPAAAASLLKALHPLGSRAPCSSSATASGGSQASPARRSSPAAGPPQLWYLPHPNLQTSGSSASWLPAGHRHHLLKGVINTRSSVVMCLDGQIKTAPLVARSLFTTVGKSSDLLPNAHTFSEEQGAQSELTCVLFRRPHSIKSKLIFFNTFCLETLKDVACSKVS